MSDGWHVGMIYGGCVIDRHICVVRTNERTGQNLVECVQIHRHFSRAQLQVHTRLTSQFGRERTKTGCLSYINLPIFRAFQGFKLGCEAQSMRRSGVFVG